MPEPTEKLTRVTREMKMRKLRVIDLMISFIAGIMYDQSDGSATTGYITIVSDVLVISRYSKVTLNGLNYDLQVGSFKSNAWPCKIPIRLKQSTRAIRVPSRIRTRNVFKLFLSND